MDAAKNPDYLRTTAAAVGDFRTSLGYLLEFYVINTEMARGRAPAVLLKTDVDPTELRGRLEMVNRAAGRASAAPGLTNMYVNVQSIGAVDPIAAWETMTKPEPVLEADDVLGACNQIMGRLEAMTAKAEAEAPPAIGAAAMHPLVWGAARRLWGNQHYRQAVSAAADAVINNVKSITGRNDVVDTSLLQEVFSDNPPSPGKPRLRWPGDPKDQDVKNMIAGLRQFAPGVQMTIRNPMVHQTEEVGEQDALERLATLSLLARWVETCDTQTDPPVVTN